MPVSAAALPEFAPQARPEDVQFIGAIPGFYSLRSRVAPDGRQLEVFACRLCSISTTQATVVAPVSGAVGETVSAHFDDFGVMAGTIQRVLGSGFVIAFELDDAARYKLASRIMWQKKRSRREAVDKRQNRRVVPRDPRSTLIFGDGQQMPCFVINYSGSSVAVSAPITPELGTALAVGRLVGRVARTLDVGFEIEFIAVQTIGAVEARLVLKAEG
jgi:hypothetical protein